MTAHKNRKLGDYYIHEDVVSVIVSELGRRSLILWSSYSDSREVERQVAMSPCRGRD